MLNFGDVTDGEDIVLVNDGDESAGSDWGNDAEVVGRDVDAGCGRVIENWSVEWEEQYGRMNLDDRLAVELTSIGLLPVHVVSVQCMYLRDDQDALIMSGVCEGINLSVVVGTDGMYAMILQSR